MSTRTRVLLVDDHPIVISGIRRLLAYAPDFEVVGQASTARDAVENAIATDPDMILLDLHLPDVRSADLCRRIRATVPSAQVVIFTAFVEAPLLRTCLARRGRRGPPQGRPTSSTWSATSGGSAPARW